MTEIIVSVTKDDLEKIFKKEFVDTLEFGGKDVERILIKLSETIADMKIKTEICPKCLLTALASLVSVADRQVKKLKGV